MAVSPVDLRRGFDGLSADVEEVLQQRVVEGGLFVFTNRRRNRLPALHHAYRLRLTGVNLL